MARRISTSVPEWLYKEVKQRGLSWSDLIKVGYQLVAEKGVNDLAAALKLINKDIEDLKGQISALRETIKTVQRYIGKIALKQELTEEDLYLMKRWINKE